MIHFNHTPVEEHRNEFNVNGETQTGKYLGFNITKSPELLCGANYNYNLLHENLVKTNILPRLLYLFQSFTFEVPVHQFVAWDPE